MDNSINNNEAINLPRVSVIVPTYNRPQMLLNALNSIATQTYRNFEIIVVNDDGADVTEIISQISCPNITYIRHPENKGLPAARNTGIKSARGKYLAYLDDDDIYYPNHLEVLINYLDNSAYSFAYTDAYAAYQHKKGSFYETIERNLIYSYDFDPDMLLYRNYIPILCIVHKKSCLDEVGLFDETLLTLEDWDLWIRLSRKYDFSHIKEITCEYSRRSDYSSMTDLRQINFAKTRIHIYNKYNNYCIDKPDVLREQYYRKIKSKKKIREIRYHYIYDILKAIKGNIINIKRTILGLI